MSTRRRDRASKRKVGRAVVAWRFEKALTGPSPHRPAGGTVHWLPGRFFRPVAHGRLDVFDAAGRRVATLAAGRLAAGPHAVRRDGLSDGGAELHGGIYFARPGTVEDALTRRLVLVQ